MAAVVSIEQLRLMREARTIGARLRSRDWNSADWRVAWAKAWVLVGMTHSLAVSK